MFSGIVESQGIIREFARGDESAKMVVEMETDFSNLEDGESIAVNGVCLTVIEFETRHLAHGIASEVGRRAILAAHNVDLLGFDLDLLLDMAVDPHRPWTDRKFLRCLPYLLM